MLNNSYAYLVTDDIKRIYENIKGNREGIKKFLKEARIIAFKTKGGKRIYTNKDYIYDLFKEHIGEELNEKGIDCYSKLLNYIS